MFASSESLEWEIWSIAGNIIDGSNGDVAVDHYHRYLVLALNLFFIFTVS